MGQSQNPGSRGFVRSNIERQFDRGSESNSKEYTSSRRTTSRLDAFWIFEILTAAVSISCLGAIVVIFSLQDEQPLSHWTFYFSLNTVISVLATVSKTTMLFAVGSAISQGKWNLFRKRPGQLQTFQAVDQASRGGLGSLKALFYLKVGLIVPLGAFISLVSLAFEPSIQAAISNYGKFDFGPGTLEATVGSATNLSGGTETSVRTPVYQSEDGNGYWSTVNVYADPGLQAAILGGFATSREANSSTQLSWSCPTGNCTWPLYGSFAICSECHDVSTLITSSKSNHSSPRAYVDQPSVRAVNVAPDAYITNYTLGFNGLTIDNWDSYLNDTEYGTYTFARDYMVAKAVKQPENTANFRDHETLLAAFSIIKSSPDYMSNRTMWKYARPMATECGLFLCLRTYNTTVTSGQLNESVIATTRQKVPQSWQPEVLAKPFDINQTALGTLDWNPINKNGYLPRYDFQLDPSGLGLPHGNTEDLESFNATQIMLDSTVTHLADLLRTDSLNISYAYDNMDSKRIYTTPTLQALFESPDINETFSNVADSMTSYLRNVGNRTQVGSVRIWNYHYRVRWAFITLPAFVVIGGATFLALSILQTHKQRMPVWKNNLIATMVFTLDPDTRSQLRNALLSEKLDDVGSLMVYMHERPDGVELSSKPFTDALDDDEGKNNHDGQSMDTDSTEANSAVSVSSVFEREQIPDGRTPSPTRTLLRRDSN